MTVDGWGKGFREQIEDIGSFGKLVDRSNVGVSERRLSDTPADFRRQEVDVVCKNQRPG